MKPRNVVGGALVRSIFRRPVLAAAWVVCLVAVSGCSLRITGVDSVDEFQAEDRYNATYAEHMTQIHVDAQRLFAPTATSPGVCNVGGSKQGCYDADLIAIEDLQAMLNALEAIPVPPRYADADRLLREGIAEQIRGLELRNQSIAENDQAAWTEHQVALEQAAAILQQAYAAFPADNRPQPPP